MANGPFSPHANQLVAVYKLLPDQLEGLVAIHNACVELMEALDPYVDPDVGALTQSIKQSDMAMQIALDQAFALRLVEIPPDWSEGRY